MSTNLSKVSSTRNIPAAEGPGYTKATFSWFVYSIDGEKDLTILLEKAKKLLPTKEKEYDL